VIDLKILRRGLAVGLLFEVLLVVAGHYKPWLRPTFFLFGCMMIAGVAGILYARDLRRGFVPAGLGGAAIGVLCGVTAVGVSNLLGDRPDLYLPYGVVVATVTGAIGALFGQAEVLFQAYIKSRFR